MEIAVSEPLITVVIPVFNSEQYIEKAVNSVLLQPNADSIELILVDDGSTDNSANICDKLSEANSGVKVFHKENGGVSSARNMGIENAKGKYIAFLDSDDWWERAFLSDDLAAELLRPQSSDLYCFSFQKVSPNKKWIKTLHVSNDTYVYNRPALSHIIWQSHCAFLYRRDYLNAYGFRYLPTEFCEDVPFCQLCCTFAKTITCMDRIIFSYYMNNKSCIHTKSSVNKFKEHFKAENLAKQIYETNGVSYNIDRTIISLIGEYLEDISIENSFGFVKELIAGPEFFLLNHSDIQPWQTLQKDIRLWRKKPILAYIKCRINGIPKYVKRFLYTLRITRPLADYIQYRLIKRWG